jgi:hypothetical protein
MKKKELYIFGYYHGKKAEEMTENTSLLILHRPVRRAVYPSITSSALPARPLLLCRGRPDGGSKQHELEGGGGKVAIETEIGGAMAPKKKKKKMHGTGMTHTRAPILNHR